MGETSKRVLVTGAAGFIGSHLMRKLKYLNYEVMGIDNFNSYYSGDLKRSRITEFKLEENVLELDLLELEDLQDCFSSYKPEVVIHLAAQPGVRYSRVNPMSYISSNIVAFENILQTSMQNLVSRFMYASSSSIYGDGAGDLFEEENRGGEVKNLYALTKRFNEDRAFLNYSQIESVGMRFFSVYGPWGRPDMACMRIIGNALGLWEFNQIGDGEQLRDYTYIEDVVSVITAMLAKEKLPRVINVGGGVPISLKQMRTYANQYFSSKAGYVHQAEDTSEAKYTRASTKTLSEYALPIPSMSFENGMKQTCLWASGLDSEKLTNWLNSSR
jgi:UDP-glucuronate 4-epimerase